MFDIRWIREEPKAFDAGLARRNLGPHSPALIEIDKKRREYQTRAQVLQTRRNELSRKIGKSKARGEDASQAMEEITSSKEAQAVAEGAAKEASEELNTLLAGIPNIPSEEVPKGTDESDNVELRRWGELPSFDFSPKEHFEIGETLGMMDFEAAARMSGARFCILSDQLARLERALGAFMLDLHTQEHGYVETYVPFLVNSDSLFGTGQLPKFEEDQFSTDTNPKYFLIPTAEVPVTNLYRDQILEASALPVQRVCHTPCFRREAGSHGKDTRGMIRQHQFEKVELVHVVRPSESWETLEVLTRNAEAVLQRLELPYRVVTLCTGDLGFSSAKTYDLEVWLPGQQAYREISSCSNFEDFQARRMRSRWRNPETGKPELVHTLNGSGLAVGRTLVAVMENGQNEDGSVRVPEALRPYLGGTEVIRRGD